MLTHRTRRPRAGSLVRRAGVYGLPVIDETSAGGLIIDVQAGRAVTAVIARRNRGRLIAFSPGRETLLTPTGAPPRVREEPVTASAKGSKSASSRKET